MIAPLTDNFPPDPTAGVVVADGHRDDVLDVPPLDDDLNAAPPVSGQRDDVIVMEPSDLSGAPLADPLRTKVTVGFTTF
jgi:hypothetical protein